MLAKFWNKFTIPFLKNMGRMNNPTAPPVVVVLGATGTGKTKLSIELAQKFNGEVVNADSLQVYKGLDIITNKVTKEEMAMVPHHLIDFLEPLTPITVVDFRNRALKVIQDIFQRNKMPVIVGGTHYYIEALLWEFLIDADKTASDTFLFQQDKMQKENQIETESSQVNVDTVFSKPIFMSSFKDVPSDVLYNILMEVDPEAAQVLHPNDRRKVIRILQIIQRNNGTKYSDLIKDQHSKTGGSNLSGPLRYPKTVIFWTHTEPDILNKRLDDRVDEMLRQGLLKELTDFHTNYASSRVSSGFKPDYTEGIFQAIGFKEFHSYLVQEEKNEKLLEKSILEMKVQTRRYAKKQMKWIRNRLLEAHNRIIPPLFQVNTSHPENWVVDVRDKAFQIMERIIADDILPHDLQPVSQTQTKVIDRKRVRRCDICNKVCAGQEQWEAHVQSKGHRALKKTGI